MKVILCVYLNMKARLNLTIEESLLAQVKQYAVDKKVSVSELVEEYFSRIASPAPKSDLIDFVKSLPKTDVYDDVDLKKQYFEENASKYGF